MLANQLQMLQSAQKINNERSSDNSEKSMIQEMLNNGESPYWEACLTLVKKRVYARAKNLLVDDRDEIVQDVMEKLIKKLPTFRYECAFKSWLHSIIMHCICDKYRAYKRYNLSDEDGSQQTFISLWNDEDFDDEQYRISSGESAEETLIKREDILAGWEAAREYTSRHSKSRRNQRIISLVMIRSYTCVDAAQIAGCSPAVAGYVVREAQCFARKTIGYCL